MIREPLITLAIAIALFLPLAWLGNAGPLAACLDHSTRAECEALVGKKSLAIRP